VPRLSAKAKILITILIYSVRLIPVIIATLSLYVILRTAALIYLTLILIIYFVA